MKTERTIYATIIVALLLFTLKECKQVREIRSTSEMVNDELEVVKNEKGQQEASIKTLQLEREKDLLRIKTKDSTIQWLQETVKDYRESSTKRLLFLTTRLAKA